MGWRSKKRGRRVRKEDEELKVISHGCVQLGKGFLRRQTLAISTEALRSLLTCQLSRFHLPRHPGSGPGFDHVHPGVPWVQSTSGPATLPEATVDQAPSRAPALGVAGPRCGDTGIMLYGLSHLFL